MNTNNFYTIFSFGIRKIEKAFVMASFGNFMASTHRVTLEGQVDEFLEVSEKDGRKAVLSLHVTFLDLKKRETAARVIFQREYAGVDPYAEKTPTALAQAMSRVMGKIPRQIILDLQEAVRNR